MTPSAQTIAPGQTAAFRLHVTLPGRPATSTTTSSSTAAAGRRRSSRSPLRSLVNRRHARRQLRRKPDRRKRPQRLLPAGPDRHLRLQRPGGQPELSVALTFANDPGTEVFGTPDRPQRLRDHRRRQRPRLRTGRPRTGCRRYVPSREPAAGGSWSTSSIPSAGRCSPRPTAGRSRSRRRRSAPPVCPTAPTRPACGQADDGQRVGDEQRRRDPGRIPRSPHP